jgi:hypothetical protein
MLTIMITHVLYRHTLQCLLMDSYRAAAAAVVADYEVPAGGAMFFYSSHRGYWSEAIAKLVKTGAAPRKLIPDIENCVQGGRRATLLLLWSQRTPGGGVSARYSAVPVPSADSAVLRASFMVHPSLGYAQRSAPQ